MLPKVSVNMAISLDGKISTRNYTPARFTSDLDFQRLLELRAGADALLVGRGTLEADSMTLTVPSAERQPLRCVISHSGRWPSDHALFSSVGGEIILAHTGDTYSEIDGVEHLKVDHVKDLLSQLAERGVRRVHCEGGGDLLKELLENELVDQLNLTWAGHTLFGGTEAPSITGTIGDYLSSSRHFELVEFQPNDAGECFLRYQRVL